MRDNESGEGGEQLKLTLQSTLWQTTVQADQQTSCADLILSKNKAASRPEHQTSHTDSVIQNNASGSWSQFECSPTVSGSQPRHPLFIACCSSRSAPIFPLRSGTAKHFHRSNTHDRCVCSRSHPPLRAKVPGPSSCAESARGKRERLCGASSPVAEMTQDATCGVLLSEFRRCAESVVIDAFCCETGME